MPHFSAFNRFYCMLCYGLVLLLAAACGGAPASQVELTSAPGAATAAATEASETSANNPPLSRLEALPRNAAGVALVAKVNDVEITLPEFERALARRQLEFDAADPGPLEAETLDQLINQVLIEQAAAARGIGISEAEVQAEMAAYIELAGSPEAWGEWLQTNLYTQDEFNETLRSSLLTNRVRDAVSANLAGAVPQVHARHILVNTQAEALTILNQIQSGQDFGGLANTFSKDVTTREIGGDLGWFAREELLTPELAQVAFSLQAGEIAGPIPTTLGFHILQTLEFASRPIEPEKQAHIARVQFENWVQSLYTGAVIERYLL